MYSPLPFRLLDAPLAQWLTGQSAWEKCPCLGYHLWSILTASHYGSAACTAIRV